MGKTLTIEAEDGHGLSAYRADPCMVREGWTEGTRVCNILVICRPRFRVAAAEQAA